MGFRSTSVCAIFLLGGLLRAEENLVDRHIFGNAARHKIPVAEPTGDSEFLRRIYLDLWGRLPEPQKAREFLASKDPDKRLKLIDSLFPPLPTTGGRSITQSPFLDRWAYFFNDLYRNGQLLGDGINTFYDYVYKSLLLNVPYDEYVREMLTASTVSTWTNGAANLIARNHVFEGDGYQINHEDTADEIAINTTKLFLGVNLECVSCHDGRGHLEKINLWLADRKRTELWKQASFFGKTFIAPVYGRTPEFMVKDTASGYDLTTRSSLRPPRSAKEPIRPAFILGDARPQPGESDRQTYARVLTTHPQFARATVNLIWAELMGEGIVDPPFDFDLARQDPANPPPAPWTIQPSNPELLNALADDFRTHAYDLRRLMRTIVSSRAYQLSAREPKGWKPGHDSYFSHRIVRRLTAEQLWDSIFDVTGMHPKIKVASLPIQVPRLMQTRSPKDLDGTDRPFLRVVQAFGECDRYQTEADRRPGMVQAAILLNEKSILDRIKVQKGNRLERLLSRGDNLSNEQLVDELFLTAISRPATAQERAVALEALRESRQQGGEDLLWALINRLDFLFY